jgi:peptide/nickel transport system permease protein
MRQNSFLTVFLKNIQQDKLAFFSVLLLGIWIIAGVYPYFNSQVFHVPVDLSVRLEGISQSFWFGVDSNGQSLGLLLLNGASTSLFVSVSTVSVCLLIGLPLGALSGYYGGKIDFIISRCMDILLAFPPLILPIAIMAFLGGGILNVVLALSVTGWVSYARLVRGQFLAYKEREFVMAAKSIGASQARIIFKHIMPNILSPLIVQATFSLANVIIAEAGLSFLGLGVSQEHVSWGGILNSARDYLVTNPNLVFFPAAAIFSLVISLNFVGEALKISLNTNRV